MRFYLDFPGFRLDWEHRFAEDMPLYRQVSREGCVLHLSEHHGDATPGSAVRMGVADVRRLQSELVTSDVNPLRIGLDHQPWGDDLVVPDPALEQPVAFPRLAQLAPTAGVLDMGASGRSPRCDVPTWLLPAPGGR